MNPHTQQEWPQAGQGTAEEPFDLDIKVLEGGGTASLIRLTDDGCNPSCPESCATNVT
jgi:FxLD family lantipeptide